MRTCKLRHSATMSTMSLILLALLSGTVNSATILVQEQRLVRSSGNVASRTSFESWVVEERSPGLFGEFNFEIAESRMAGTNQSASSAMMVSNISGNLIVAEGSTASSAETNEPSDFRSTSAESRAEFMVTFQILEPYYFDLQGLLSFDQTEGGPRGGALLTLRNETFFGGTFNLSFGDQFGFDDFSQQIQISGLLEPDTYTLSAFASSNADSFSVGSMEAGLASFNIALSLTPIPMPATIWLFASALGLLAWVKHRTA